LADEVEITNVGGDNGVASEATLLLLLNSFDKLAKGQGTEARKAKEAAKKYHEEMKNGIKVIKDESEAREENTDALEDNTRSLNMFRSTLGVLVTGISGLIGGVSNFAEELAFGRDRISDFAQHVPFVGEQLSILTRFIDEAVDSFRDLASVGVDFGGSLFEIKRFAAQAGLSLDTFVSTIQGNSENLARFSGSARTGAMSFSQVSRIIQKDFGQGLSALGLTMEETAEYTADYLDLQTRLGRTDRLNQRQLAEGTNNYIMMLDRLSKLTGKRRDQVEAELEAQRMDAAFASYLSTLDDETRENVQEALVAVPENLQSGLRDMFASGGNLVSQEAQDLAVAVGQAGGNIGEFQNIIRGIDAGRLDESDLLEFLERTGDGISEERAKQLRVLSQAGDERARAALSLIQIGDLSEGVAKVSQEQQDAIERGNIALLDFERRLQQLRSVLVDKLIQSGVFSTLETSMSTLIDMLTGPKGSAALMNAIDSVVTFFEGFIQDIQTMGFWNTIKNTLVEGFSSLMQEAKLFLFGGVRDNTQGLERADERLGELKTRRRDLTDAARYGSEDVGPEIATVDAAIAQIEAERKRLEETQGETVEGKFEGLGRLFGMNQPDNSEEIADIENQIAELQQQRSEITNRGGAGRKERRDIDSQISDLESQKEQLEGGGFLDSLSKVADILAPGGALLAGVGILAGALALVGAKAALVAGAIGLAAGGVGYALNGISNIIDSVTNGFKTMSDELEDMSNIDASSLAAVASSMDEIGSTMIKMAGAGIIEAISGGSGSNFLKNMAEGFKAYENINGGALLSAKDGVVAIGEALRVFNEAVSIDSLGDFASRLIGTDDFVSGLVSLAQGLEPIDGNKLQNVAPGVEAVSRALEVFKSSTGFQGLGDLVSRWFSDDAVEVGAKIAQIATDLSVMNPSQITAVSKSIEDMSRAFTVFSDAQVEDFNFRRTAINRFERLAQLGPGLESVSTHITDIAGITGLDNQLEVLNAGLDVDKVNNYAEAMEKLVEVLEDLNKALAEDNEGLFGGTGVAAEDVIENMNTANQSSNDTMQELNTTMMQILAVLRQTKTIDERIERNTSSIGGNIASGRVSNIR
jgi:hypothetical protein